MHLQFGHGRCKLAAHRQRADLKPVGRFLHGQPASIRERHDGFAVGETECGLQDAGGQNLCSAMIIEDLLFASVFCNNL